MIPKITFHGVKVELLAKGELKVENNRGEEVFSNLKELVNEELVLLDEYENIWTNENGDDIK